MVGPFFLWNMFENKGFCRHMVGSFFLWNMFENKGFCLERVGIYLGSWREGKHWYPGLVWFLWRVWVFRGEGLAVVKQGLLAGRIPGLSKPDEQGWVLWSFIVATQNSVSIYIFLFFSNNLTELEVCNGQQVNLKQRQTYWFWSPFLNLKPISETCEI